VFVLHKPFQLNKRFVDKAGAYLRVDHFECNLLGLTPGLSYKYWTRLERPTSDKHSSVLRKFVNSGRKKFYSIGLRLDSSNDAYYLMSVNMLSVTFKPNGLSAVMLSISNIKSNILVVIVLSVAF
jgi:hypothetical protein